MKLTCNKLKLPSANLVTAEAMSVGDRLITAQCISDFGEKKVNTLNSYLQGLFNMVTVDFWEEPA